jgi:hypothetical protein
MAGRTSIAKAQTWGRRKEGNAPRVRVCATLRARFDQISEKEYPLQTQGAGSDEPLPRYSVTIALTFQQPG